MKHLPIIILFLIASLNLATAQYAAEDAYAKLQHNNVKSFSVSESGNIYLFISQDEKYYLYKSNLTSQFWNEIKLDFLRDGYIADDIFCNLQNDILIFGASDYKNSPVFFRSTDGGKSFKNVGPRTLGCMYEVWTDGKKNVAYVDGYTELFISNDAGKSWSKSYYSDNEKDWRCSGCNYQYDLYFDPDMQKGWICGDSNKLYFTPDSGKTFQKFKTPVDQFNIKLDDFFDKVKQFRHIGNHYFVNQGRYFYTSKDDSVNWQKVDSLCFLDKTSDGGMIAVTRSNNIVAYDSTLKEIWSRRMPCRTKKYYVLQDKIYLLTHSNDIYIVEKDSVVYRPLFVKEKINYSEDELKQLIHGSDGRDYIVDRNEITCRDKSSKKWNRVLTHSSTFEMKWMLDSVLYVWDKNNEKYKLDYENRTLIPYQPNISHLKHLNVIGISFIKHEVGYPIGCMGPYVNCSAISTYIVDGDRFVRYDESLVKDILKKYPHLDVKRDSSLMKDFPSVISKKDVEELKSLVLNAMEGGRDSFSFHVTKSDIQEFKDNLDQFIFIHEPKLYKEYVDTAHFENLSADLLHTIFSERTSGFRGSSTSKLVVLRLSNGQDLLFYNGEAWPNYMETPSIAYYKNEPFDIENVNVGIKLNDITEGHFVRPNKKSFAIYKIADYMIFNR